MKNRYWVLPKKYPVQNWSYIVHFWSFTSIPEIGNTQEDAKISIEQLQNFSKANKSEMPHISSIALNFGLV